MGSAVSLLVTAALSWHPTSGRRGDFEARRSRAAQASVARQENLVPEKLDFDAARPGVTKANCPKL